MKSSHQLASQPHSLVLGVDIGVASLGWALVEVREGQPVGLKRLGVRVFEEGVEGFNSPKEKSRAVPRREARSRRRMIERTRRRLTKLARCLQRGGLLPPGELDTPEAVHSYFLGLDQDLFPPQIRKTDPHRMHYRLRARALHEKLTPYEIGRAIYHLSQRRGFKSNRKSLGKGRDDDRGKVKGGIKTLREEMEAAKAQTLGEYFAGVDPEKARIRGRYLHRETMVECEFNLIWEKQAAHHSELLTDELRIAVHDAIFFQRDLKTPERFIGYCELEPKERRAPFTDLRAQRFRLLQKVNDLRYIPPDGVRRELKPDEREKLVDRLETKEKMYFDDVRKALKLDGGRFNFETIGETGIIGNRVGARLAKALTAKRWKALSPDERSQVVNEFCALETEQSLRQWAVTRFGLGEKALGKLLDVGLESGHCNLSLKALDRLLPLMENGTPYATAVKCCYPDRAQADERLLLPPVKDVAEVRNPAVQRALTELRTVVNAIVREHGKPDRVRVELARDLKKNREQRRAISFEINENQQQRNKAIEELTKMDYEPSGWNIEKLLLWEECNQRCPYTGAYISPTDLFGDPPQFQVEHIIPPSLCPALGNAFINKTLCRVDKNQQKGNRTPWQAFGNNPDDWDLIIDQVSKFRGRGTREVASGKPTVRGKRKAKPFVHPKLELFQLKNPQDLDDFTRRQLTDTQYAARLAVRYIGQLYGAGVEGVDSNSTKRVEARRAGLTAQLRRGWSLERQEGKKRSDHRHHAIDALCTALADSTRVKELSDAWERGWRTPGQRPGRLDPPWPTFLDDVRGAVDEIVVSHRVSRKLAKALHEERPWSARRRDSKGREWVHQRKPIDRLSGKEVGLIADCKVRQCVQDKLGDLGESDPKKAFQSEERHPRFGRRGTPIYKVRLRKPDPTRTIRPGDPARQREVVLGSNHHLEVMKTTNTMGVVLWKGVVVSTYDAMQRVKEARRAGSRANVAVKTGHADGAEFLFSLAQGETIELDDRKTGERRLYVVEKVTKRVAKNGREGHTVGIVGIDDARPSTGKEKAEVRALEEPSAEQLRERRCRKVVVTPLGEVRRARD